MSLLDHGLQIPDRIGEGPIWLRLPRLEDIAAITAACQDPEIARWTRVPQPYTETHARQFVSFARAAAEVGGGANLMVVDEHDEVVASCGLPRIDWELWTAEIGYWVAAPHRRRGIAVAAVRLVVDWGFGELGLRRLEIHAAVPNAASNQVALAAGFTLEGTLREATTEGLGTDRDAARMDQNIYGLLATDPLPPPPSPTLWS